MGSSERNPGGPFQAWLWLHHWQKKTPSDFLPSAPLTCSLSFTNPGAQGKARKQRSIYIGE